MTPGLPLLRAAVLGLCAAGLAACGVAGPLPSVYVLGQASSVPSGTRSDVGRPIVELVRVAVPDYLDTSDLLVRRAANELAPSLTGRWGERLSVGVTRALAQALSARLPGMAVVSLPPTGTPALRLLVDVEAFEARPDGTCILVARWSAAGRAGRTLAAERISLVEPVMQGTGEPSGDAALTSAMTRAVDALADRIAAGVQRAVPASGRRTTS